MQRKYKRTPPRLPVIFQRYDSPVYFVTFNTHARRPLLADAAVHAAFVEFAEQGLELRAAVGRYVLMPDHVHAFVCIGHEMTLGRWVRQLKQHLHKALLRSGQTPVRLPEQTLASFWQPGFVDHLLRHDESYGQKWHYVWENPVRAGLAARPEDWPYQGEIARIDRVASAL
jgi:REP element-mobilizing transposase RayT